MLLDKSFITNLVSILLVISGLLLPTGGDILLSVGLFALSGAVTNWLAVYMLFERVPLMYGSGVIPNRFEEFKTAIKTLMMKQFFNQDNLTRFIGEEESLISRWFKPQQLIEKIDYDQLFKRLVEAIMQSSFGGMLGMIGGASALSSLKEPIIDKIKLSLVDMVNSDSFQQSLASSIDSATLSNDMRQKIEVIVDKRLNELTPELVKQIVQDMIKIHLGWLVVWGGVVGGMIGLVAALIPH